MSGEHRSAIMRKAITTEEMVLLKEASEMFNEAGCVPGPDGEQVPAEKMGLLQLLGMSLPPCCRFHPAEVMVPCRSDFGTPCCLRPSVAGSALGATHFRGHMR